MLYRHEKRCAITFSALAFLLGSSVVVNSQTRVSIGVTETIETANPYGDSVSLIVRHLERDHRPFLYLQLPKGRLRRPFGRALESGESHDLGFLPE